MATQATVTLATREYLPRGTSNGVSTWLYKGDATFGGNSELTGSVSGPSKAGMDRVLYKLVINRVSTTESACACPGELQDFGIFKIEGVIPDSWTKAMRDEAYARLAALAANSIVEKAVEDNEGTW